MFRGALPDISGTFSDIVLGTLTRVGVRSNDDGPEGTPLSSRIYRRFSSTFGAKLPYLVYSCILFLLFIVAVNGNSDSIIIESQAVINNQHKSLRGSNQSLPIDGVDTKTHPSVATTAHAQHSTSQHSATFYVMMFLSFFLWVIIIQIARCLRRAQFHTASSLDSRNGSTEMLLQLMQMRRSGSGANPALSNRLRMALLQRDFNGDDYEMLQTLDQDVSPRARRGASQQLIDTLPLHTVSAIEVAGHETQAGGPPSCVICLGPYEACEEVRTLPCLHRYHKQCIDTWLKDRAICPVCKHAALSHMPH